MTDENNKIAVRREVFQQKKVGMQARLAVAEAKKADFDPTTLPNRIGMLFDDSSSMTGKAIELAHTAVETFIKNCNSNDTALAIYPLNEKAQSLSNDYAQIGIYAMGIPATGGTPLYTKLQLMLGSEKITRAIAFSDGDPTDKTTSRYSDAPSTLPILEDNHEVTIQKYVAAQIPLDTVFIGNSVGAERIMRELAERTGGTYLHFTKPEDMAKNLKYLAPRYRALLANAEIKAKVERGESI